MRPINLSLLLPVWLTLFLISLAHAVESDLPKNAHALPDKVAGNHPAPIATDGFFTFEFGEERLMCDGALQPFALVTSGGTVLLQGQIAQLPHPSKRMHYPQALKTVISHDHGLHWTEIPLPAGENGMDLEGGAIQLRDGSILALDTYITPGPHPGEGVGLLYSSKDDWRTVEGPIEAQFDLPGADFYSSKDDNGRPHESERLHRRIIELPSGDLLTTVYGILQGDRTPSTYMPSMLKSRVMLIRSSDRGRHWKLVATIAADPVIGTEGFGEPVLTRVSTGAHAGRLICFMRTGRELYEGVSDNEGRTWSRPLPRTFAYLDINRTEFWIDMFRGITGRNGRLLDNNNLEELKGAVVDPDLIELRGGLLVAAFGVRIPQKANWQHPQHPWNGNYLAISRDHGESWSNVIQITSGVLTTHYMSISETQTNNELFIVYDFGHGTDSPSRYLYGRTVKIAPSGT